MRTVFSSRKTVFLPWVREAQEHGRTSRWNISFHGNVALSYQTPIGVIERNADGQRCFIITSQSYSSCTAKHVSSLRNAVWAESERTGDPVFTVDEVRGGGWNRFAPHGDAARHTFRLACWNDEIEELQGKASRARVHGAMYQAWAIERHAMARAYQRFFKLDTLGLWLEHWGQ